MRAVSTICVLALKEYYRRRILIVVLLMMLAVAGAGLLSNPFTLGVQGRLMRDIALLFIQVFAIFFPLALSSTVIPNEIERKLLYPYLARAISRSQYLWGKFLAVALVLALGNLVLGLELVVILAASTGGTHWVVLGACFLLWLESMVISAFAFWFSTFMTAPVTFASMVLLYVVGNLSHVYVLALTSGNIVMQWFLLRMKSIIPYFDYFSIRSAVTHEHPVSIVYFLAATLYGLLYVLLPMLLAEVSFLRRDL